MSRQIEVGYEGGTVVRITVDDEVADTLFDAAEKGGWHRVDAAEGTHALNLGQAVYIRVEEKAERIGFGGS